jgi:hypothetical protein
MLAYTPFLDPLNLHDHWWFTLIPLALGISMAYKAVRLHDLRHFWKQSLVMTVQVILGMVGLAAVVFIVVELIVPRIT